MVVTQKAVYMILFPIVGKQRARQTAQTVLAVP